MSHVVMRNRQGTEKMLIADQAFEAPSYNCAQVKTVSRRNGHTLEAK